MRQKQFSVLEWAGSCEVCTKLPITTDFLCNWTPFRVITTFDFLAEINKLFYYHSSEEERRIGCAQKLLSGVFLYLNRMVNSHLNSFILITTVLVLSTNPQRAVHRYPTGSSSCTTGATVSLIIPFPWRNFLHFVFCICILSIFFTVNATCLLGRKQKQSWKCQDTGGPAAPCSGTGRG